MNEKQNKDITKKQIEDETKLRLSRIDKEFADGFEFAKELKRTVTIFGSARFGDDNTTYQQARTLGGMLANEGYTVVTGGSGGIMEAGNRGAFEKNGESVGLNIQLPHEQSANQYTTREMSFHYFFSRKVLLAFGAEAFVYFPGGYGTMDELFEILTLVQTKKIPSVPIILFGSEFWNPLDAFIRDTLISSYKTASPGDENIYYITDSFDEVIDIVTAGIKKGIDKPTADIAESIS